jgi:hypothetical protein
VHASNRYSRSIYAIFWLAERRLVAHNPSLARQASRGCEVPAEIQDATESLNSAQLQNRRVRL